MSKQQPAESGADSVVSPFSDAEHPSVRSHRKGQLGMWLGLGGVIIAILAIGGYFLLQYVNDPLRTLEPLPVTKYMDSYKALAGSKFKGDLRVENDLGWKEGVGRLMVFSLRDDPHPIVVMIPPNLSEIYFTKGQTYKGELEVKEGGLIYANSIRKN